MVEIKFTKMEGAGNDYVYINLFEESLSKPEELAVKVSHRHYGIGADGLVLIAPGETADLKMIMYNADGSLAEMCGNAIRCVGKYAWERGLLKSETVKVETGAGIKTLFLKTDSSNMVGSVSVMMGEPELEASKIPSSLEGDGIVDRLFDFDEFSLHGTLVSMGNPHFVTFVEDVENFPVKEWGTVIENAVNFFPNRINVEFVQVVSEKEVIQRTWERGSGETWACGTGASAVGVAGVLTGRTGPVIVNHLLGGDLTITWKGDGEEVVMEGPAREVFSGIWKTE